MSSRIDTLIALVSSFNMLHDYRQSYSPVQLESTTLDIITVVYIKGIFGIPTILELDERKSFFFFLKKKKKVQLSTSLGHQESKSGCKYIYIYLVVNLPFVSVGEVVHQHSNLLQTTVAFEEISNITLTKSIGQITDVDGGRLAAFRI